MSTPDETEKSAIKCVVWDLDNTLWQGTLLEGDDIVLAPGAMSVIQALDHRGILQSIASKNDFDTAWGKLMALGVSEYFLYPQIGWANKSDSIKTIAEQLGVGLSSFALVDDQVLERDEVRHYLPEVATIDAADIGKLLGMARMQPRFVTGESKMRRKMYQADIRRKQFEGEFPGDKQEFLETLGMCLTIRIASELDLRRAEELTIRTNQLNTTGRTYSYEELKRLLNSRDYLLLVAELEDRYGSSGTIGLALVERRADVWLIKLLIMSCRVMTRGVGNIIISYVLESAKRSGVRMFAEFVATSLNRMMYVTYKFQGFYEVREDESSILLEHDLKTIRPYPGHITVRLPSDEEAFGALG